MYKALVTATIATGLLFSMPVLANTQDSTSLKDIQNLNAETQQAEATLIEPTAEQLVKEETAAQKKAEEKSKHNHQPKHKHRHHKQKESHDTTNANQTGTPQNQDNQDNTKKNP